MNECMCRPVCWDNSVTLGSGALTILGYAGWLELSSLQISSLPGLRFLLLLWGIVCFLHPVHQTHSNELFLFSCLPAMKSFPPPQNVPAQGWLAWQLRLLIRIHWCEVCTGPLTLITYRCCTFFIVRLLECMNTLYFVVLNCSTRCVLKKEGTRPGLGWCKWDLEGRLFKETLSERPPSPHPSPSSERRKGGGVCVCVCMCVC